jgi:hypothetical protein
VILRISGWKGREVILIRAVIRVFKTDRVGYGNGFCGFMLLGRVFLFDSILGSLYGINRVAARWRTHLTH